MSSAPNWLTRGAVSGAHGIRGLVRVTLRTDFPERVIEAETLTLQLPDGQLAEYGVERVERYKAGLLVKFAGIDDRTAAQLLAGAKIVTRREDLPPLGPDEIYWHELIGLKVVTTEGREIGEIADILRTGSSDVYVTEVPSATGRSKRPGPLIPAIDDVLEKVDPEAGVVIIKPMPGLLDED